MHAWISLAGWLGSAGMMDMNGLGFEGSVVCGYVCMYVCMYGGRGISRNKSVCIRKIIAMGE